MSVAPIKDKPESKPQGNPGLPVATKANQKSPDYDQGWDDGYANAQGIYRHLDNRLQISMHLLQGLLAGGHRAESGPQLAGLAWQYAGWLLEEAGK